MFYLPGKLPNAALEKLLAGAGRLVGDPRVIVGPRIGEDAAVLDMGGTCLVITSDPITFATDQLGWYAVQVNANDVAARGARPRWFLAVLLLPERETDDALVSAIFEQIYSACEAIGCVVIGGHTEITLGLNRPIVVGQMLGEVGRERLVTTGGAQVGDTLLLTKGIAIEGTALLARERELQLRTRGMFEETLQRAKDLLFAPGIGVVKEALTANEVARVHAMHDPTEGGLATGIAEMAQAAGVGVWVEYEAIPVLSESAAICSALGIDPLGTLASGSLLLSVAQADSARVIEALAREQIPCSQIGRVVPRVEGLKLKSRDALLDLPTFARDEIARAME
jgi:hydrogenase expression/formation protein HypE